MLTMSPDDAVDVVRQAVVAILLPHPTQRTRPVILEKLLKAKRHLDASNGFHLDFKKGKMSKNKLHLDASNGFHLDFKKGKMSKNELNFAL